MAEAPHPNALPGRSMKRCPGGNATGDPMEFVPAVKLALAIGEKPPGRDDLELPDDDDINVFVSEVESVCGRADWKNQVGPDLLARVTPEEAKAIAAYTLEHPYPLYKWINAWLMSNRRDDKMQKHIGPFFVLLYRALEKLPRTREHAARGVQVRQIPGLMDTFQNYKERCAKGSDLNFWGFASFSTRDDVSTNPQFVGDEQEPGVVYACGELDCVDIAPFSLMGAGEAEVLPLPPLRLKVQSAVKYGQKLIVSVEQVFDDSKCYVVPRVASGITAAAPPAVAASAPAAAPAINSKPEERAATSKKAVTSSDNSITCDEKVDKPASKRGGFFAVSDSDDDVAPVAAKPATAKTSKATASTAAAVSSSAACEGDASTKMSMDWEHAAVLCQRKDDDDDALKRCSAWISSKPDEELQALDKLTIAFCVVARTCVLFKSNPTEAPTEKAISLWHRLEAAWKADKLPQGANADIAAQGAASLAEFLWRDASKYQTAADVCATALRFTRDEAVRAKLVNARGVLVALMGKRDEGVALLKEALEMRRRIHRGVDHPDVAQSLNGVGSSLLNMGKRDEGVALLKEALEMHRRIHRGVDHPDLAYSLNSIGISLKQAGKRDQGVALKKEALEMYRRIHRGVDHRDLAVSLNNVGISLEQMGNREEGVALKKEALEMYRRIHRGVDHPDVAQSLNSIGISLKQMGKREEGLALQQQALEMRRRIHRGVDHPDLAQSLNNVGCSLEEMGKREEGVALVKEALEMRRRIHRGVDHPDLANSLNNVGMSLERMGKREEGVALLKEALEMYRRLGAGYEERVTMIDRCIQPRCLVQSQVVQACSSAGTCRRKAMCGERSMSQKDDVSPQRCLVQ